MLGHGHQVPGTGLRHPRRRPRPGLPAPRERTGPVQGGRRRVRPVLDAQRPGRGGREKMSKSLGNSLLVDVMVTQVRPVELRYYLGQAHYRSAIEYSPDALAEAGAAYRRIEGFVTRAAELVGPAGTGARPAAVLPEAFSAALDDDLGVPLALAAVHDAVRDGNNALATGDAGRAATRLAEARAMLDVLGLDPMAEPWASRGPDDDLYSVVSALVSVALAARQAARERRDYAAADAIRDELHAAGVVIEDTPNGPRWELKQ